MKLYCACKFIFCFFSSPYNVIFLSRHLFLCPLKNSHGIFRAGNEGPRFIVEMRQSNKILGKISMEKKMGRGKYGLWLLRSVFPLTSSWMWKSGFLFFLLSVFFFFTFLCIHIWIILLGSACLSDCVWGTSGHSGNFSRNLISGKSKVDYCHLKLLKRT